MMKFLYDKDVDAAYIYFEHTIKEGGVKKTKELSESILVDYDEENKLLGMEILNASEILHEDALNVH